MTTPANTKSASSTRSHSSSNRSRASSEIELAPLIDHTLLAPAATTEHILQLCDEADRYRFAAVCVYPVHVPTAVERLYDKKVKVCTVIGFPSGATTPRVKLYEAQEAIENGASELDVVINLGWLKMGETNKVHDEIARIVELCDRPVKAILETTILTREEKQLAAEICLDAGVSFLKTSTGWQGGATVEDVKLLRQIGGDRIGIKASGGIRTPEDAIALVEAGATRLGTSRGVELLKLQAEAGS